MLRVVTRLNVGGPTRHVTMLMRGISGADCQQRLACGPCPQAEGPGVLAPAPDALPLPHLVRGIRPWADLAALRELSSAAGAFQPRILHSHMAKAGLLCRLLARRQPEFRAIHTFHGHTFERYFRLGAGRLLSALEAWLSRHSAALVVQSEGQRDAIAQHLGLCAAAKVRLIRPAVQNEFLTVPRAASAELRMRMGIEAGTRMILLPARLAAVKAPLRALSILRFLNRHQPCMLVVPGDGPMRAAFVQRVQELGLSRVVKVLPFQAHLWELLDCADLVLLTSRSEGTPLVILEAHARGTPVAATDVGAVREMLSPADLLIDAASADDSIAERIHDLLLRRTRDDPAAQTARQRVAALHSEQRLCAEMLDLYRSVI